MSHTLANTTQWSACLFSPNDLLAEIFFLFSYGFLATAPSSRIAFPYSSREMENFQIQNYVFVGMADDCRARDSIAKSFAAVIERRWESASTIS